MATPSACDELGLPASHALSMAVAAEYEAFCASLPAGVESCRVASAGLVELMLRAVADSGFACRSWPLFVGGVGVGDEPAFVTRFGGVPRSPLAVRFGVPISMHG
eukprot:2572680-Prymnesium_polylepis.1